MIGAEARSKVMNKKVHSFSPNILEDKQTCGQLVEKFGCFSRTIQRCLNKARPSRSDELPHVVNVVMGTTCFVRKLGVMVFKNSLDGAVLPKKYVRNETMEGYVSGIAEIVRCGISVQAIMCDGKRGVMQAIRDIPVQPCQFHQVKTVTKYLTQKLKLATAKELRVISHLRTLLWQRQNQAETKKKESGAIPNSLP